MLGQRHDLAGVVSHVLGGVKDHAPAVGVIALDLEPRVHAGDIETVEHASTLSDDALQTLEQFILFDRVIGRELGGTITLERLTTETSQDKRDQGKAAGGTGWIVKPFDPEKLISVIHRVVH